MRTHYRTEIEAAAGAHALDPDLVEAMVLVESSGMPCAYRHEPGFWRKYMAGKPEFLNFLPERYSASYGLMQTMWIVAVEMGFDRTRPPEHLCVPEVSLTYGCRKLAQLLGWSKGNRDQALAAYNGGRKANAAPPYRNLAYVHKVHAELTGWAA
jgi:soluble lytic murein transglycosylase-like protein